MVAWILTEGTLSKSRDTDMGVKILTVWIMSKGRDTVMSLLILT